MATTTTPMPTTTPDPGTTAAPTTTPDPGTTSAPAISQLAASPVVPPIAPPSGARKAVHFAGPVVVGGKETVQGQVLLAYRFDIDFKNGNFGGTAPGVPIVFPTGSVLLHAISSVTTAFDGTTPKFNLGTTVGGTDVLSLNIGGLGKTEAPTSPSLLPALPTNGTIYASVTGGPFTVGHASVAIEYLGAPAAPWS